MARGRYVKRTWPGNPTGQTRRERLPTPYEAYVPEPLWDYDPTVSAGLAKLLAETDAEILELNRLGQSMAHQVEALARQLLRQEALASSRIEGLSLSQKRIGEAAYDPDASSDNEAKAVLANIDAMHQAIAIGSHSGRISRSTILKLHLTLMRSTNPEIAGKLRTEQNWVGGNWHTPIGAAFVPPPPSDAGPLLTDLASFMSRTDLPPTLQAALTHAQFETIHPFADGNGRIGRCLIHVVYKRLGIADHQVPPISLLMATDVDKYVKALNGYREDENLWVSYFAETARAAARAAVAFGRELADLQDQWRAQAKPRGGSTADQLIALLPIQPVIDVPIAAQLAGTSEEAARVALNALEESRVVSRAGKHGRGRVWEAKTLWEMVDRFERRLATPDGAMRANRPAPRGGRITR